MALTKRDKKAKSSSRTQGVWRHCGLATRGVPEQLGLQSPVKTESDGVSPLVPATDSSLGPRNAEGNARPGLGVVLVTMGWGLLALICLEGE